MTVTDKLRFIPACAGNRYGERRVRVTLPVHPRVCGEQEGQYRHAGPSDGSSPRVRGTAWPDYR